DARTLSLLPDVLIFHKAVHDALKYQEFFAPNEIKKAKTLLETGRKRAEALSSGDAPWTTERGLVVRGYRSKIDGSIQPYGLVIPDSYTFDGKTKYRLDIWFHGRGETLSEVNFLNEHMTQPGQFTPTDTIVLHPYGRYCNAFKFAGEVDVYEALESTQSHYKIDPDLISVRGFSMGGAACWQFAVHDSSRWFAANPGAGFAETARFLDVFQKETLTPTWYEQKLWRLYDCDLYATNLHQCPTVAYSGEIDSQKQAADVMEEALAKVGIRLTHIIGPQTKHAYHPDSKVIVQAKLDSLADSGRNRSPQEVHFATYTLRYNRMNWLTVNALDQHWEKALVRANVSDPHKLFIAFSNVSAFTIDMPAGTCPLEPLGGEVRLSIGGIDQPR
ncbi:MAG TPA: prolyl oligopeptidase family serine peptidase, partial [Isosphaeraceae bacterium]|nr:prolyl oligopeptidase family serine peptidase [Isosphaeraceae bacterium]